MAALEKLAHPGIVGAHTFIETSPDGPLLVMEYVDGVGLDQLFGGRAAEPKIAIDLLSQLLKTLEYIHEQGLVHRDVKPANLLVEGDRSGTLRLVDFGLVRDDGNERMTATLEGLGTRSFAAPEQFNATPVDARADLFAAGKVMQWLLLGQHAGADLSGVPGPIMPWLRRATALAPDERFQTATQMLAALDALRLKGMVGPPLVMDDSIASAYKLVSAPTRHQAGFWMSEGVGFGTDAPVLLAFCAADDPSRAALESHLGEWGDDVRTVFTSVNGVFVAVLNPSVTDAIDAAAIRGFLVVLAAIDRVYRLQVLYLRQSLRFALAVSGSVARGRPWGHARHTAPDAEA